jgi:hypothetical protein
MAEQEWCAGALKLCGRRRRVVAVRGTETAAIRLREDRHFARAGAMRRTTDI